MKTLERRIVALEGPERDDYSHLSDEELKERIVEIIETLTRAGFVPPDGWRKMIANDEPGGVIRMALEHFDA